MNMPTLTRVLSAAGLFFVIAALTGCGNSRSGHADTQAARVSQHAAGLLLSAGDYRPAANFPVRFTAPLSAAKVSAAMQIARQKPSGYLAPRSAARDLRHASAMLADALSLPRMRFQFKGLLAGEKALVELAAAQLRLRRIIATGNDIQSQVNAILRQSDQLTVDQKKITGLRARRQMLSAIYMKRLSRARTAQTQTRRLAQVARQKLAALHKRLAFYSMQQRRFYGRGVVWRNNSRTTMGETSLRQFKKAMHEMNLAALAGEHAENLAAEVAQTQAAWELARLRAQAARSAVVRLAAARRVAAGIARRDTRQIAVLLAGAKVIVAGPLNAGQTIQQRLKAIQADLQSGSRQAKKAIALCRQARQSLLIAVEQQRKNYVLAQNLRAGGVSYDDPLVRADTSHVPECMLDIHLAYAAIQMARIDQLLLWNAGLRKDAAVLGGRFFSLIRKAAPLQPPPPGERKQLRQAALAALQQASVDLTQAQGAFPAGQSPVKWLTPALQYEQTLAVAAITNDPTVRTAALQQAAKYAAAADKLNPRLKLGAARR